MTDMELAEEIEWVYAEAFVTNEGEQIVGLHSRPLIVEAHRNALAAVIAALRREPSGEMVMVPREPTPKMFDAGWKALNPKPHLTDLGEAYRAMLSAAEAEVRKPCPLCGRTNPHSHTSGPLGIS